jgi:hypothetical protein
MERERPFKPIEYACPICGERTTFGAHFCKGEAAKSESSRMGRWSKIPWKTLGAAAIAILMIEVFLWEMIGALSLYCLAALGLGVLIWSGLRKLPFFRSAVEYKTLVKLSGGDKEAAERQIFMEKLKRPDLSRKEHIAILLEHWRRDLR